MTGFIHSIETMGLLDGPGARTVFFLQGCPLKCAYCHNPDSQPLRSATAHEMSPMELLAYVQRQRSYYQEDGGVTFSGGEPLLQGAFLLDCLKLLKENGVNTAVDTSGFGDRRYLRDILSYTDTLLLDVKAFDADSFRELTGGDFSNYLRFLDTLRTCGFQGQVWLRHVMVPGLSDSEAAMDALVDLAAPLGFLVDRIDILPYHELGLPKYRQLGLPYRLEGVPPMDRERARELERYANKRYLGRLPHDTRALNPFTAGQAPKKEPRTTMPTAAPGNFRADSAAPSPYIKEGIDLRKLPLLRHLSVSEFDELAHSVAVRKVKKGEFIFRSGDPAEVLYIVCEGQFKILTHTPDGREQIMYIYNPGDFVGGLNLLKSHSYLYFGQALEDGVICTMDKPFFDRTCLNNPVILRQILEKSYDRIRWAEELVTRLSSSNAGLKVAELLLRMGDRYGSPSPEGTRIDLSLNREELGSYAGLTRETITRKLGEFKELGYVDYTSNRYIVIKDEQALRAYVIGS